MGDAASEGAARKRPRDDADADAADDEQPQVADGGGAGSSSGAAPANASNLASRAALAELPSAEMYEKSFMHRDHVTHIVVTSTDFVVTCSRDGQLKFWKKMQMGIEFVKHFRAHLSPITGIAATIDGSLLATVAGDKAFKVFDVYAFDMISWVKLDFTPTVCEWVGGGGSRAKPTLAVADADAGPIRLFDATSEGGACVGTVSVHTAPVLQMKMNSAHNSLVSIDARGVIEYWSADGDHASPTDVSFRYKTDTDLYAIAKARASPLSLAISPDGEYFAVSSSDFKVRKSARANCRRPAASARPHMRPGYISSSCIAVLPHRHMRQPN